MGEATAFPSRARRAGTASGIILMSTLVLLVSNIVAVAVGAVAIPLGTVWGVALDRIMPGIVTPDWSSGHASIVWEIRFPRVMLAGLVGAGLALLAQLPRCCTPGCSLAF